MSLGNLKTGQMANNRASTYFETALNSDSSSFLVGKWSKFRLLLG